MRDEFPFIGAFALGILAHVFYFRKGEHHLYPGRYVYAYTGLTAGISAYLHYGKHLPTSYSNVAALSLVATHLLGLFSSLVIYRVYFHPLRQFPGPSLARISTFGLSWQLREKPFFRLVEELHDENGQFVRIDPSTLSISHPKAVSAVHGARSPCTKAAQYDAGHPMRSLQTHRSRADHDKARRIWLPGFTDKALRGYQQRVRKYRQTLFDQIGAFSEQGKPVNISDWINWYSFDAMSDLAFGESFNMLVDEKYRWIVTNLIKMGGPVEKFVPAWVFRLVYTLPGLAQLNERFNSHYRELLERRIATKLDVPDITACFLEPLQGRAPTKQDFNHLIPDAQLIVLAGSDTTAMTLVTILYELARRPEEAQKLRAELADCATDENGEYLHDRLAHMQHLNGFINETLRLYPPVPTIVARKTPPEGLDIDGTWIPGDMNVLVPQWAVGRSEAAYKNAREFIPERWYLYPEMIKDKSAFAPFTIGPYTCLGKPLALMNIRALISRLVMAFDIEFTPGDDGHALDRGLREHFSLYIEDLHVVFKKRV